MGDVENATQAYQEARTRLNAALAQRPDDFRIHMALGLVQAGLGQREDALACGERALGLNPLTRDAWSSPILHRNQLFLLTQVGETNAALAMLDSLLSFPNPGASPALFRIEPRLENLRTDPRFQAILAKHLPPNS